MPDVSRYLIRASLLWLIAGGASGAALLIEKGIPFWPGIWILLPVHINLVIFGWMVQFVLGVAYWMMPKYRTEPLRGPVAPAWFVFRGGLIQDYCSLSPAIWVQTSFCFSFPAIQ